MWTIFEVFIELVTILLLFKIYFLAILTLCCCAWAFFGCDGRGIHFLAMLRLLTVKPSHPSRAYRVCEFIVAVCGLRSCGAQV